MKTKNNGETLLMRETCLLPAIIADGVIGEVSCFLKSSLPFCERTMADRLAGMADRIYMNNKHFRKLLKKNGNVGRDTLYSFMRHWLSAILKEEHTAIYNKLPSEFNIGHPLPTV